MPNNPYYCKNKEKEVLDNEIVKRSKRTVTMLLLYQRIQDTCWRRPKKTRIYNWLRLIAQVGSYPDSIDRFLNGTYLDDELETWVQGSKRTLADYVQCCKNERINMINIPVEYGIDWLPNPMPEELR